MLRTRTHSNRVILLNISINRMRLRERIANKIIGYYTIYSFEYLRRIILMDLISSK